MPARLTWVAGVFAALVFAGPTLGADFGFKPKPLDRIRPGTQFSEQQPPEGWSDIIVFVDARLGSGDYQTVSKTVKYYSDVFNLVLLGNATQDANGRHVLDKVAIGFSMVIDGKNTIVSSNTHRQLNSGLSLIGGQVLAGNEEALVNIKQVGRTTTSMVLDAPTMMLINGQHREMVCRYAIWADTAGQGVRTAVWLLDGINNPQANYQVVGDSFQFLPANMHEDRVLNVKKEHFSIVGLPKKEAFALVRIPQGTAFPITAGLRQVAGVRQLDANSYKSLWASLTQAMREQLARQASAGSSRN